MKSLFIAITSLTLLLNGCSTLMNGKYVSKDGKPSPFHSADPNPYEVPSDPTLRQ
jgi:PBP1b-binding outer membrane lipoprotein LpoB